MKITSRFLGLFHLNEKYYVLSARDVAILLEFFKAIDVRNEMAIDDVQFLAFMKSVTDLSERHIYKVFDTLDVDCSGLMDFDEFYLLVCILIAVKDKMEKEFIYKHSRTVFDLLDEDGSNNVSIEEFKTIGFLFNFNKTIVKDLFKEFDVSGDQHLDYQEFRMFAMACIDKQTEQESRNRQKEERKRARVKTMQNSFCSLF
ncbi:EF-hand calcium-binding domain-containing protein 9-like [Corticium candelabrum]|uniref:EF-hand calcium-binding domain-containing protein 9-like n=1 Tax=Corticium candelabrum TaxID=121492 RepID=UPI002E26D41F|nr:EF-hand calcium-binding domain-containing protein 9-like [Corticium candelabrum]